MVITILDEKLIRSGEDLLKQLDNEKIRVDAALWFYFPEAQKWKLLISLPDATQNWPKEAYETVQKVLGKMSENYSLSLDDVTVVLPESSLIETLTKAINTGPGIHGIRFTNNVINGQLIEDAYIYRLEATNPIVTSGDKKRSPIRKPVKA
jgi:hypothetical protein